MSMPPVRASTIKIGMSKKGILMWLIQVPCVVVEAVLLYHSAPIIPCCVRALFRQAISNDLADLDLDVCGPHTSVMLMCTVCMMPIACLVVLLCIYDPVRSWVWVIKKGAYPQCYCCKSKNVGNYKTYSSIRRQDGSRLPCSVTLAYCKEHKPPVTRMYLDGQEFTFVCLLVKAAATLQRPHEQPVGATSRLEGADDNNSNPFNRNPVPKPAESVTVR